MKGISLIDKRSSRRLSGISVVGVAIAPSSVFGYSLCVDRTYAVNVSAFGRVVLVLCFSFLRSPAQKPAAAWATDNSLYRSDHRRPSAAFERRPCNWYVLSAI